MAFSIEELAVPATLEDAGGADFAESQQVADVVKAIASGTDEMRWVPAEALVEWHDPFTPSRLLCVRQGGQIVARGTFMTRAGSDVGDSWVEVTVLPEFRRRGIGTALADAVEALARADGRTKALVYIPSPEGPGDRLPAPTGRGSLPRDNEEVRFLLGRGYTLEQVERGSRLALPFPFGELAARLADAAAASGPDYTAHTWVGVTPERWLADMALLATRMSTDAPSAGLDEEEDVWTVERLVADDARQVAGPRIRFTAGVEHRPSGQLVGFTELSLPSSRALAVEQWSTLVLREHRGHRLGMLLKVANLAFLEATLPGHPSVITYNAEENRHMLDVNEHLGFRPFSYDGGWKKMLA